MTTAILGYQVNEQIYESGNSLVYRGCRGTDKHPVILKMLKQAYPSPEKIAWFKREYERTRNLNSAAGQAIKGVVEAYSLETDQHRWVMVLEDFEAVSLDLLMQRRPFTITEFLPMAIQIVDILGQVHQRFIIHKDINPSNIISNPTTGQLKLIDFGISTTLSRENPSLRNLNMLEGTLAYMSPEQTGRMNRAMDYRTDFYSLGATFYELLTGQLPFPTTDAMELVHTHIAKYPTPPHELKPDIPQPLSEIVMKLMAKNAEDRYQSAYGLKADLEECRQQWQAKGRIDPFSLSQHDISDRFQIPQKLYGREREIDILLAAFERVSQGSSEMLLVSGYSGIGKSALVKETHKSITRQRGYFISGKFDQLQRDIPYASLVQAFRSLIQQLLLESEVQITAWRQKLLDAFGPNGQVIIDVIPEVELIIGPQPAVPELSPPEAQNRFNLTFQNFIKVFTRPEHPLVLFVDDLQWADSASLKLIQLLITAADSDYLFVIGAYRNNEVGETHPLMLTLNEIRQGDVIVNDIVLGPLDLSHVTEFTADTVNRSLEVVKPLAELMLTKTGGNPFFMSEFLKSLYTEELLVFAPAIEERERKGGWQWNLSQIQARNITDNVVELMASKVQKLGKETQQVLKLAACIGNQFDLQTLAIVYEKSPRQTAIDLWEGIAEGLVLPLADTYKLMDLDVQGLAEAVMVEYKFSHDRIQQAAYSLIPTTEKQNVHWQVGRLLLQNTLAHEREQKIFDIVNQLNRGLKCISHPSERDEVAELNLMAGRKAKASAAYQAAFNYLQVGLGLLTPSPGDEDANEDSWYKRYDLTLALHVEAAEAAYLSGNYEQMERLTEVILQQARTLLDKVRAYEIRMRAYYTKYQLQAVTETGLDVLKLLGIEFPEKPSQMDVGTALEETKALLAGRQIGDLVNLPEMSDPQQQAIMRILWALMNSVSLISLELSALVTLKAVNLSIQYGNAPQTPSFHACYGVLMCGGMGDLEVGYQFGKLAVHLGERLGIGQPQAIYLFNGFIRHWKEHAGDAIKPFLETHQNCLETGDLTFATFSIFMYLAHSFWNGRELNELEQEMVKYMEVVDQLRWVGSNQSWNKLYRQTVLNLLGRADDPHRLAGEIYNEAEMLPLHQEANDALAICYLYLNKVLLSYLFREYAQAVEYVAVSEQHLGVAAGMQMGANLRFYDSLAHLAIFPESEKSEQERILARVAANQEKIETWAKHAPMNYLHKFYLIEAERACVLGQANEARVYYDQAIDLAHANKFVHEEALANELAGKFYLARGLDRVARHYLRDAHYAYRRWGAIAKVKDLEARYPQLLLQTEARSRELPTKTTPTTDTGETTSSVIDLTSVLKASQAISGEIVLDQLLEKLMKIVIENAGAQRGYLILEEEGHWVVEAEAQIEAKAEAKAEVKALQSVPVLTQVSNLSHAIINYVIRTKESVVLNDATHEGLFTQDAYIIQHKPKSILCAPLINQGKLNGMLYLENNLATGAFTPDRLEVLNILSAQAAISIENARLYTRQVELTQAASRFVPFEFLRFLQKENIVKVKLGDQVQQNMTILVSDIRSFTTLSEKMTPQENFDFVNAYLSRVSPIIRQHHGSIAKYMGDGLMAVFPGRVEDALDAAIAQMQEVARYNLDRQQQGETPIQIGLGIHTGPVMLGTVGEAQRMQMDLLSDAVNVTVRLEGLSKLYGVTMVISTEVLGQIEEPTRYHIRFLGKTPVKGRQEMISVFEVFDGDPAEFISLKLQTKTAFEEGLSRYHEGEFAEAKIYFEQVLQSYPDDKAAHFYLQQMADFSIQGLPTEAVVE